MIHSSSLLILFNKNMNLQQLGLYSATGKKKKKRSNHKVEVTLKLVLHRFSMMRAGLQQK